MFYYNIPGQRGLLAPSQFGKRDPIQELITKLRDEGTKESYEMAKKLYPKMRIYAACVVRGEEDKGVQVWGFGKMAYQKLLTIVLDPDYGDITDPETGNDLKLMYGKQPGASFPTTDIRPRPRKTPLCDDAIGGDERCAELLETIPNFDEIFERKTTEEVQSIMDQHLSADTGKAEVERFGNSQSPTSDSVESAFNDLLSQ